MNRRHALALVALCAALSGTACGQGEHRSLVSSAAPATNATLAQLTRASRDCLQYPVETRQDGTQIWNADYFYFSLIDRKARKPYVDSDGKPAGQALLASQALAFMAQHPELEARTDWAVQLGRQVQEVRGEHVTLQAGVEWVEDYDIDVLLAKDAAARKQ